MEIKRLTERNNLFNAQYDLSDKGFEIYSNSDACVHFDGETYRVFSNRNFCRQNLMFETTELADIIKHWD